MKRILVYVPRVLPLSLTFVEGQARALERWSPLLVGRERASGGLAVDDLVADEMRTCAARPANTRRALMTLHRRIPVLQAAATRTRPDLVHAHFLTGGFDVVSSLRPLPCPVVVTAHGFDATWYGAPPRTFRPQQWWHGLLRSKLLHGSLRFIAVSRFIREQLVDHGAAAERVVVHHTGVDTSFFTPPPSGTERRGILFVGRLVPKKGAIDLLEAVARLRAAGVDVPIELIGDGPQRGAIEAFIRRERLAVTLRGAQPLSEVRDAMRRCAVLASPSRTGPSGDREGFGMVLAEAQACGLPVVATTCGGMVDAVDHGRTGLLVPETDPEALETALSSVLTDGSLHARLAQAARPWVTKHFDLSRQTAALEDLYDQWASEAMN